MKTYLSILTLLGLISLTASAQDDRKLRSDGTYSVHNYKHPNKAAIARKWSTQSGIAVPAPGLAQSQIANYKQPVPNQTPTGGLAVSHTPLKDVALRNYKIQRVYSTPSATSIADKAPLQPSTEGN